MRVFLFIGALLAAPLCAPALSPLAPSEALALQPDEILKDPALEARAREISKELRCLVCQNQSIDDSDAPLARDLRLLLRDRLVAGDSDTEAIDYIVDRYGDYVLLKPPFNLSTLLLWATPLLALLAGILLIVVILRRRVQVVPTVEPELSAAEKKRLKAILERAT